MEVHTMTGMVRSKCESKLLVAREGEGTRVNIEKVQKIAKAVRNIELLVEFEFR